VAGTADFQIRSILVPTDFSEPADAALDRGIDLARLFGAELQLLHAYQLPVQLGIGDPVGLPQELFDQIRAQGQDALDARADKAKQAGVSARTHLLQDAPSHAIPDAAERLGVDLVVMGTRGLTGMKHVLLGSVAERSVRLAPCPVMTVHGPG